MSVKYITSLNVDPKVCIIILQYANSEDTQRCLDSVKELEYPNYRIIVVDNASSLKHFNSTRLFIETGQKTGYANFEIIQSKSNLGYSGGNNIGIKQALKYDADYIFILNPDTFVEKDSLTKLVKACESTKNIGICGPAISENGQVVAGGEIEWLKPELHHISAREEQIGKTKIYIPGAAMLIKKEVIEKIGLLDERYFLYFEDGDYCLRAQNAGYVLKIIPEALVYHRPSSSTSSLGVPLLLRYHFRNALLFNLKNGPIWAKIALPFWSFLIIIKQIFKCIMRPEKREIASAIMAGVVDFYKRRFGKVND